MRHLYYTTTEKIIIKHLEAVLLDTEASIDRADFYFKILFQSNIVAIIGYDYTYYKRHPSEEHTELGRRHHGITLYLEDFYCPEYLEYLTIYNKILSAIPGSSRIVAEYQYNSATEVTETWEDYVFNLQLKSSLSRNQIGEVFSVSIPVLPGIISNKKLFPKDFNGKNLTGSIIVYRICQDGRINQYLDLPIPAVLIAKTYNYELYVTIESEPRFLSRDSGKKRTYDDAFEDISNTLRMKSIINSSREHNYSIDGYVLLLDNIFNLLANGLKLAVI